MKFCFLAQYRMSKVVPSRKRFLTEKQKGCDKNNVYVRGNLEKLQSTFAEGLIKLSCLVFVNSHASPNFLSLKN